VTARRTGLGRGLEALIPIENEFSFKTKSLRVIDRKGHLVGDDPGLDPELYQQMYRNMVLARELDRRMLALQRQGRIGTYAMLEGQEAVQIGSALALEPHDFVFPSYREHG
jgi:2-oxoisovalerate dehydrogenase E1 component alpha subunit